MPGLTGCFSYQATPPQRATPGSEVRVTLAEGSTAELARFFGPRAASVDGRVVSRTDSALTLAVSGVTRLNGVEERWPDDVVSVPRSTIEEVRTRRLARARSAAFTAGVVAAIVVLGRAFRSSEDVARGPGRPGDGSSK